MLIYTKVNSLAKVNTLLGKNNISLNSTALLKQYDVYVVQTPFSSSKEFKDATNDSPRSRVTTDNLEYDKGFREFSQRNFQHRENSFNSKGDNPFLKRDSFLSKNTFRSSKFSNSGSREGRSRERPKFFDKNEELVDPFESLQKEGSAIDFSKYDVPIKIKGSNIPSPIEDLSSIPLPREVIQNIEQMKVKSLFPIQKHGISIAMQNRDLIGCAQTGSGKTLAYLIPAISKIYQMKRGSFSEPRCLIVCPTRELAQQLYTESRKLCVNTNIRTAVCFGGASPLKQSEEIAKGADIIIGTPGRLGDFISNSILSVSKIMYTVLDEADRMLDMGFLPQIQQIIDELPPKTERQTLMFSATFPEEIQTLASSLLKPDFVFLSIGRVGAAADLVDQQFIHTPVVHSKIDQLFSLISTINGQTLIFVEKKLQADIINSKLQEKGIFSESIHGDKSQSARNKALFQFNSKNIRCLVATNVAARGLDLPHVNHVINFELPPTVDDYIHRIGRTGRAGKFGTATTFISGQENPSLIGELIGILKEANKNIPSWLQEKATRQTSTSTSRFYQRNNYQRNNFRRSVPRIVSSSFY